MKLHELLSNIFRDDLYFEINNQYSIYGDYLKMYKNVIHETDEFKDVKELVIMDAPLEEVDGDDILAQTRYISDNVKFNGVYYLYSLSLTPEMYDPVDLLKPVKDKCGILPVLYDALTFEPERKIIMSFSIEHEQDLRAFSVPNNRLPEVILRENLHNLLDKILDSPNEYAVKGFRRVVVRGCGNATGPENDTTTHRVVI